MDTVHPDTRSFLLAVKTRLQEGFEVIPCDDPRNNLAGYSSFKIAVPGVSEEVSHYDAIHLDEISIGLPEFQRENFLGWLKETDLKDFYPPRALAREKVKRTEGSKLCSDAQEFLRDLRERVLAGDDVVCCDNPKVMRIGYLCSSETRDLLLELEITSVKNAPEPLKQAFRTAKGRQSLLKEVAKRDFKIGPSTKEEPVKVTVKPGGLIPLDPTTGLSPDDVQRAFQESLTVSRYVVGIGPDSKAPQDLSRIK